MKYEMKSCENRKSHKQHNIPATATVTGKWEKYRKAAISSLPLGPTSTESISNSDSPPHSFIPVFICNKISHQHNGIRKEMFVTVSHSFQDNYFNDWNKIRTIIFLSGCRCRFFFFSFVFLCLKNKSLEVMLLFHAPARK